MATYYWVGGSNTWDTTSTANWSDSSGGSSGFGPPTSADDVIFDAASNVGTGAFTVTVSAAVCRDFSTGGAGGALDGAMTLAMGTSTLSVFGNWTNPAANFAFSGTGTITFASTTTGNTITTNGVSWPSAVVFDGVGGAWTLGGAWTTTSTITVTNGNFSTSASNYNLSATALLSSNSNTRTISLNASAVTLSLSGTPFNFSTATGLTFNAGTSTITCSGTNATFNGGGQTFYNVSFTAAASGTHTISGVNTFNNLTFTSRSGTGVRNVIFSNSQTVNGTLTFGAANTAIRRIMVFGSTSTGTGVGTAVTLTVATLATLADVNFRDITAAGASAPWSGTRIGDGGGNSNITFTAGATKYWNLAGGGNWSATAWATGSGGAVDVNNFPLPQDTVVIEDTGLNSGATITVDFAWGIPNVGASTRTLAFTLAGNGSPQIYKEFNIPSVATVTASGNWYFAGRNTTQTITTNGVSVAFEVNCNGTTGNTVSFAGAFTTTNTITVQQGTLNLNNNTITALNFSSNNSNTRTLAFGTGNLTLTGNSVILVSIATVTNLTITGTPVINATYSGSTGTRTISIGATPEASSITVNVSAGTDTIAASGVFFKTLNFTGFSGTLNAGARTFYGNLTVSAGMTISPAASAQTFAATSGTQTITSNGNTIDAPITINAPGATVVCADALTMGSSRTLTLTAGTLKLKDGVTSTVGNFATSGTSQKFLQSTTAGVQATLSEATGTVDVSYLTIQDINATGGATWNAYVDQGNIDAGNNDGWNFGISPVVGGVEYTYQLRSFTEPRRF